MAEELSANLKSILRKATSRDPGKEIQAWAEWRANFLHSVNEI